MTKTQATAEVFYTAMKAMPKAERDALLVRMASDKAIREDLLDIALVLSRENEPSIPLSEYVSKRARK
jgi:hypothetical protein